MKTEYKKHIYSLKSRNFNSKYPTKTISKLGMAMIRHHWTIPEIRFIDILQFLEFLVSRIRAEKLRGLFGFHNISLKSLNFAITEKFSKNYTTVSKLACLNLNLSSAFHHIRPISTSTMVVGSR